MAFWKRSSRKFEPVSSQTRYTVTYLGHEEMKGKVGLDNTLKPVDDLYKQFKKVKSPSKMEIEVVNNGIRVVPLDAGVRTMFANSPYFVAEGPFGNVFFPINKLSFGAADPFHTKVFCFVSRNDNPAHDSYWDCHAVVCESPTMAKNLTLYLVKAFQRVGNSKGDPIRDAQQNKKTTTVHIIREKSTMEHQSSSRRKTKPAPVSTLKVTLNIEGEIDLNRTECNDNKKVADIIAKHRSVNLSDFDQLKELRPVGSNGESTPISNSVSKGVGTSSDKENNEMEGVDNGGNGPKEIVVTVAVNPDLNSPPESPRKSPLPQERAASSGDDDDVAFDPILEDGNISPQEMITTMSPPDTPGYLSKEGKPPSPTLPVTPTKPPSPKRQGSSNPSPRKKTQAPSPPFQNTPAATDVSSSPRQKSPRQSPTKTSPPRKPDDASHDVLRRKPPSPSPTKRPSVTPTSPTQKSEMKSEALPRSEDALSSTSTTNVPLQSNSLQNDTSGVALRSKPKSNSPTSSTSEKIDDAAPEKKKKNRKSVRFAEEEDVVIN